MCLVEYLKLCAERKFDEVRQRLSQLAKCVNWLDPSFALTRAPKGEDDSDSDSDSDNDEDMDVSEDNAPELVDANQRNQRNRPQVDEDGWTTIPTRRRQWIILGHFLWKFFFLFFLFHLKTYSSSNPMHLYISNVVAVTYQC